MGNFFVILLGVAAAILGGCRKSKTVASPEPVSAPMSIAPTSPVSTEVSPFYSPETVFPRAVATPSKSAHPFDPAVPAPGSVFNSLKVLPPPEIFQNSTVTQDPLEKPATLLPPHQILPPPRVRRRG